MNDPHRRPWWDRPWTGMAFLVAALVVTVQRQVEGKDLVFLIFRQAHFDLLAHRNLYALHVGSHLDYFRYSPTFALVFGPLAVLPVPLGLLFWNLLNAFALYAAIGRLLPRRPAQIVRLLVLGDLVRAMQSSQSNGLVAALMIAAFVAFEHRRVRTGALAVAAGTAIKIFPIGAALFAIVRPLRWRALAALAAVAVVLLLAPLPITGPHLLVQQYRWWAGVESAEVFKPMYSLMDLVNAWTDYFWPRWPFQLAGIVLLLIPVALRPGAWAASGWRLRLLASVLVFCVLFNHGAESPSYVIATAGIAIWWAGTPRSTTHDVILILTLLLSTVGRSSLTPAAWRTAVLDPSRMMVLPLLAAWVAMQVELLRGAGGSVSEGGQGEVATHQALA